MFMPLPISSEAFEMLSITEIEPWYQELLNQPLSQEVLSSWIKQWSDLSALVDETVIRFEIATTCNTADEEVEQRKHTFMEEVYAPIQKLDQRIKQQLLASGLEPAGFAIPLRNLRAEAELYREENLPLLNEDKALSDEYMQVGGSQMVWWKGKEVALASLYPVLHDPKRDEREQVWHAITERQLKDREKLDAIWSKKMQLRQQIARNAGYDDYRAYRWRQLLRFDYTPADCRKLHEAVKQVIVPTASQMWEKRRRQLGVETLRPWDMWVNPRISEAPRSITDVDGLLRQCADAFRLIDPQLGDYFEIMIREQLLDLEERPNKAPGGYELPLEVKHRPFIFGRVNSITDIMGLIFHEAGHAFHVFETIPLPYLHQRKEGAVPFEFAEVASTSMEFIGGMYLQQAGLCTEQEAAQLRIQHLESLLMSDLPVLIKGDAFQHWIYDHPEEAKDAENCRQKWAELTRFYQPDIDWSGLETELSNGWQGILHFYCDPFYFIEYAFASLGAFQVWNNYLRNPEAALRQYRSALALGATETLPELYEAVGAKFAFDAETLQLVSHMVIQTVEQLEAQA
ncbi:MAG TPA: M3 family oligoendopeptidase [Ktedonobacteraceae bacterium]|nr:M3 family oligoendopeptidase [Ktedonobacteraceae bacterium]